MPRYEYKLVPAPQKASRHKGLKGAANFAATLEDVMNAMGAKGWDYLRADILPEEVRKGLMSRTTTYRTLLVFRRALPEGAETPRPRVEAPPLRREVAREDDAPAEDASLANLFAPAPEEGRKESGA
jgi:hypothetical protein